MGFKCERCEKTVYPTEELKCLDKVWHKTCFKCHECGLLLNMKTYQGYSKQPYCSAHYPQMKHTSVVRTPEFQRLAENTAMQSGAKYHQDFEKQKGKLIAITDDPEMLRVKKTAQFASNVAYSGTHQKKQEMEEKRLLVPDPEVQKVTGS